MCDGTNGTPDLRGKFILGSSDSHAVGSTGGEESSLHSHVIPIGWDETKQCYICTDSDYEPLYGSIISKGINHYKIGTNIFNNISIENSAVRESITSNTLVSNMPPYYALSYIMKIE